MSHSDRNRELRMEMLRMRASLERAEVAASVRELRGSTDRLRSIANAAGSVGAAVAGRSGWVGLLASTVTGRPWLAALALGAVRSLKRRPLLSAVVVAAVVAGIRFAKGSASPPSGPEPPSAG
jgi:hypothetical protein